MSDVYVFDALRTPHGLGSAEGRLHEVTALRLSAFVLDKIKERSALNADSVQDVIWGVGTQVFEQGGGLARAAVIASEFSVNIAATTVQQSCASSAVGIDIAAALIQSGRAEAAIAGGVEMSSRVENGSDGSAIPVDPVVAMQNHFVPSGVAADLLATRFGFSRQECDAYALQSYRRAQLAWSEGRFSKTVEPVRDQTGIIILAQDQFAIDDPKLETLGSLPAKYKHMGEVSPGFDQVALLRCPQFERVHHVHHVGNMGQPCDGAAAVLLGSQEFGARYGLEPIARFAGSARVGGDLTLALDGAVQATQQLFRRAGVGIQDIGRVEVGELFAAVPLHFLSEIKADPAIVNVNGGAIAYGHPVGASGAAAVTALLAAPERQRQNLGLVASSAAYGSGVALLFEQL